MDDEDRPSWATNSYLARVRADLLAVLREAQVSLRLADIADLTCHPSPVAWRVLREMVRRGEVDVRERSPDRSRSPRNLRRALAAALRGK